MSASMEKLAPPASKSAPIQTAPKPTPAPYSVSEAEPVYDAEPEWDDTDVPPPPEAFPPGWDDAWQPNFDEAQMASRPEPIFKKNEPVSLSPEVVPAPKPEPEDETKVDIVEAGSGFKIEAEQGVVVQAVETPAHPILAGKLPSLYAPVAQTDDPSHTPQQLTIILRPTDDRERNKRRIKLLHSTLTSFKGRDRFSFHIFEAGKGHLIDFPNDTTRVCPELLKRLRTLMGEESWRVEEITFQ